MADRHADRRSGEPGRVWGAADLATDPHLVRDKADRVQRMFAAISHAYDRNNRVHSLGLDQRWRRAAVRAAQVAPGERVLDAACGTGDLTLLFARSPAREVVGTDFTEAMLALARRKARQAGGRSDARAVALDESHRVRFEWADAMRLPFPDAAFDVVSIAFGLRNVADPDRALAEFRRVLAPGGRLVILEFGTPSNPVIRALNAVYSRRIMPITATLLARDRSGAYRYLPRSVETFPDAPALARRVEIAGFPATDITPLTFGIAWLILGRVSSDGPRPAHAGTPCAR